MFMTDQQTGADIQVFEVDAIASASCRVVFRKVLAPGLRLLCGSVAASKLV